MTKVMVWGRALLCAGALGLGACNFDDSSSSTDPLTPPSRERPPIPNPSEPNPPDPTHPGQTNNAPRIAGTPGGEVLAGRQYTFRPSATDADGDSLAFSIQGKPSWAQFNPSTGRIHGTPSDADLGSYENIVISVTDGSSARALPQFTIDVVADGSATGSVTLAWEPPTHNTDGSALTNLSGYRIHYGTSSGHYDQVIEIDNAGITNFVVESLAPGTYFFAISAFTAAGSESDPSGEASKTI